MKETTKRMQIADLTTLATLSQHGSQYGNPCITLSQIPDGADVDLPVGTLILSEDDGADTTRYIVDASDMVGMDAQAYVEAIAREWASNEDNYQLALCLWGLSDMTDWAIGVTWQTPCYVVIKQSFYGCYYPTDFCKDERGEPRVFDNAQAAQTWIEEQEAGTYYLAHNEAGRPTYAIWEA